MNTIRAEKVRRVQNVCFMNTNRLAKRVCQAQKVCFMNTIRAEKMCQVQNICFIRTANSFQIIFFPQ